MCSDWEFFGYSSKKLKTPEGFLWECPECGCLNLGEVVFWRSNSFRCINCENVVEVYYGENVVEVYYGE